MKRLSNETPQVKLSIVFNPSAKLNRDDLTREVKDKLCPQWNARYSQLKENR